MKLFKNSIAVIMVLCSSLYSCIDSDYHLDNINTDGVVQIPAVPLGTYDAVKLKDLDFEIIEIEGLPFEGLPTGGLPIEGLPSMKVQYSYTLRNVFGSKVIKDFFHPYMTHDLSIDGILDVDILGVGDENNGIKMSMDFEVLNSNGAVLDKINIDGIAEEDIKRGKQDLSIVFSKDEAEFMQNDAKHLLIKMTMKTQGTVTLREDDYIQLSNLVIKTGGYFIDK